MGSEPDQIMLRKDEEGPKRESEETLPDQKKLTATEYDQKGHKGAPSRIFDRSGSTRKEGLMREKVKWRQEKLG